MPNQQFVSFLKNSSIYKDRSAYQLKYTTGFGLRLRRIDCGHFDLVNVFLQINLMPLLLNNHIFFLKMPKFSFHDEIKQQQIKLNIWHTNWRNFSFASFNCAERCWTIEFWNSTNAWFCCFIPSKSIFPLPIFARYISDSAFSGSMLFNIASYAQTVIWISKWTKKNCLKKRFRKQSHCFREVKSLKKNIFKIELCEWNYRWDCVFVLHLPDQFLIDIVRSMQLFGIFDCRQPFWYCEQWIVANLNHTKSRANHQDCKKNQKKENVFILSIELKHERKNKPQKLFLFDKYKILQKTEMFKQRNRFRFVLA